MEKAELLKRKTVTIKDFNSHLLDELHFVRYLRNKILS